MSKEKTNNKAVASASLREAEQNYLLSNGWSAAQTISGIVKKWKAPEFTGVKYWDGVFPGDVIFHDSAMKVQKSFDSWED